MRMQARLRRLEQQTAPSLGRVVYFPGLSHAEADHAAKAQIERATFRLRLSLRRLPTTIAILCLAMAELLQSQAQ